MSDICDKTPDLCLKCRHRYYACAFFKEIQGIETRGVLLICNKFKRGRASRVLAWIFYYWFPHLRIKWILKWLMIDYLKKRMRRIILSYFIKSADLKLE